jgi:hypothetical protein
LIEILFFFSSFVIRILVAAPSLMECQSTVPVEGHAWAMQEVTPVNPLLGLYRNSYNGRDPPAAVTQHCAGPAFGRQLAVLSAQGALLVAVGRPVDGLRQLMIECGGPEAEAVRSYFGLQGPDQATATALVLATSSALVDRQVSLLQGCGFGSGFSDFVDPDPYWESGSRGKKMKKFQWKNALVSYFFKQKFYH